MQLKCAVNSALEMFPKAGIVMLTYIHEYRHYSYCGNASPKPEQRRRVMLIIFFKTTNQPHIKFI